MTQPRFLVLLAMVVAAGCTDRSEGTTGDEAKATRTRLVDGNATAKTTAVKPERNQTPQAAEVGSSTDRKNWPAVKKVANADVAFDLLTRYRWGDVRLDSIHFDRDGGYDWTSYPPPPCGTPNFLRKGKWKLIWFKNHGHVVLEDGAMLVVQFRGDHLFMIDKLLRRGKPIQYTEAQRLQTRSDLPQLKPDAMFDRITKNGWRKSNNFDLFMYADKIRFTREGRFHASYRKGQCEHSGFWSLRPESRGSFGQPFTMMVPYSDDNMCDQRGRISAQFAPSNAEPKFIDGMMVFFGSSYYPEQNTTKVKTFTFDRYKNSVRVTGRFEGPFRRGEAKQIELTFENDDPRGYEKKITELRITHSACKLQQDGFSSEGKSVTLLEAKLDFTLKETGSCQTEKIVITPPASGEHINLVFEVDFSDSRQEYRAYNSHMVPVTGPRE